MDNLETETKVDDYEVFEETESFEDMFLAETSRDDYYSDEENDYFDQGEEKNEHKSQQEVNLEFQASELLDSYHSLAKQSLISEVDQSIFKNDLVALDDLLNRFGNQTAIDILSALYLEIDTTRFEDAFLIVKDILKKFIALEHIPLENADNMTDDANQVTMELQETLLEIMVSSDLDEADEKAKWIFEEFQKCPNKEDFQVEGFRLVSSSEK